MNAFAHKWTISQPNTQQQVIFRTNMLRIANGGTSLEDEATDIVFVYRYLYLPSHITLFLFFQCALNILLFF